MRYAFVPRIGKNVGEIGQTLGIFPRLIASVFSMQGLFPHNHPALRDPSMRLKMIEVISTAYSRVEWNKEGLPKALFFVAVVGSVLFSLIACGFAIMGFFAAPAHAASYFTSPSPTTDLSNTWLEHVFNGALWSVNVPQYGAGFLPSIVNTTTNFSGAAGSPAGMFRALAAMYSNAMLALAVIIVVYHLLSMTVHTAHEGTPMGRGAHQIWAPVRFVFALGLLVPVAGGFSSGQWLVMWLAKQGSGLASYVWGQPGVGIGANYVNLGTRVTATPDTQPAALIDKLAAVGYCAKTQQLENSSNAGYWKGTNEQPPTGSGVYPPANNATPAQGQDVMNALVMNLLSPGLGEITAKNKIVGIVGPTTSAVPGVVSRYYYAASEIPPAGSGTYEAWWNARPCGSVVFPGTVDDPNVIATGHPDQAAIAAISNAHARAFLFIEQRALRRGASSPWRLQSEHSGFCCGSQRRGRPSFGHEGSVACRLPH